MLKNGRTRGFIHNLHLCCSWALCVVFISIAVKSYEINIQFWYLVMKWAEVMVIFSKPLTTNFPCLWSLSLLLLYFGRNGKIRSTQSIQGMNKSQILLYKHSVVLPYSPFPVTPAWSSLNPDTNYYVFFRGLSIPISRSYLYVLIVISESFHYASPFPSAPFNIILAFQFIISWFPTHKFWRSALSLNTPRYLTSLKLCQITHSFSLRF